MDNDFWNNGGEPVPTAPQTPGQPTPAPGPQAVPNNIPKRNPTQCGFITSIQKENSKGKTYYCNIDFFVEESDPYFELLDILQNATEEDTVVLNIYTYGGYVETGCYIINALMNTKAHTVSVAYGICASIGAMMWSCCKERKVLDTATIMYHMPSGGSFGKAADNEELNRHTQEHFGWFMREVTQGILSDADLNKIISKRNDIYISARTMKERLAALAQQNTSTPVSQPTTVPAPEQTTEGGAQ